MANGLSRNTSVTCISVVSPRDGTLHSALATALLSNSTLRYLSFASGMPTTYDLPPILLALGVNEGLKILSVDALYSMDESLCTALKDGLGINETLDRLQLNCLPNICDDKFDLWCRALSFLRTNKTRKHVFPHFLSALLPCCNRTCHLRFLPSVTFIESRSKADKYLVLFIALQDQKTLKTLSIYHPRCFTLTHDANKWPRS
jgi:hypothetical protein